MKVLSSALLLGNMDVVAQSYPDWHPLYRPYAPASRAASPKLPTAQPAPQQSAASPAPASAPAAITVAAQPKRVLTEPQPAVLDTAPMPVLKPRKHEVSVSGDFMFGQGTVSVPFGYAIGQSVGSLANVPVGAFSADRSSTYFGGTFSYSYAREWALDVSFAEGNSSGQITVPAQSLTDFPADFTIDDQWFQLYGRYTFPALIGKPVWAYLRVGATIVQADLTVQSLPFVRPDYAQKTTSQDILGNVGAGLGYALYTARKFRIGLQVEGEGFGGVRSQDIKEELGKTTLDFKKASIDNTLYGGIGRGTVRFDYRFGQTGALKASVEGGMQVRYTIVNYPDSGSSPDELLWGPYVKVGVRYEF